MKMNDVKYGQPKLYVLIGLPASGKSTWTKNKLASSPFPFDIISSDDILEKIAQEQGKTYSEVFKDNVGHANSQIWKNFRDSVQQRHNIIWDQTNMTTNKRRKILSQIPKDYEKIAVVFELDRETLLTRLNNRAEKEGKHIPSHVVDNMLKSYDEPNKSEGFDEILRVNR